MYQGGYSLLSFSRGSHQPESQYTKRTSLSFAVLFGVNIACCFLLLFLGTHGDLKTTDSDLKTKIHVWILSTVVVINFVRKITNAEHFYLLTSSLVFSILPETAFITHYNVVHGYSTKSFIWVVFQISTVASFFIAPPKSIAKPIMMPYVHGLTILASVIAFILLSVNAWGTDYWVEPLLPKSVFNSPFGLTILVLLFTVAYIVCLFRGTEVMQTATILMAISVLIVSIPMVGQNKLLTTASVFACIGCVGFAFYIATLLYKKISGVFGKPAVDTDGNYIQPVATWKSKLISFYGLVAVISILAVIAGAILYFLSPSPQIRVLYIVTLLGCTLTNFSVYIMDMPQKPTVLSLGVIYLILPDILAPALFSGTKLSMIGISLISVSILLSLIPHIQKVKVTGRVPSILLCIFFPLLLITAITTIYFSKGQSCWTSFWNGILPFSCTLWNTGTPEDRFLGVSVPIAILAPLSFISAITNIKEWYNTSLFILSVQTINQLQPIFQQNPGFQLTSELSLSIFCSAFLCLALLVLLLLMKTKPKPCTHALRPDCSENCMDLDVIE